MLCLVLCLPDSYRSQVLLCIRNLVAQGIITTYVLHVIVDKRNVEARKESSMDKIHACFFTPNMIARE